MEPATSSPTPPHRERSAGETRRIWVLVVVVVLTVLPVLIAGISLARRGWIPVGEFAQAEMRVRDFWDHPPDLGAIGRLRTSEHVSSHPGPAAWWAMYPVYALLGRSASGLSMAVAVVAAAWIAATLVLLWRRAGDAATAIAGLLVVVLVASFGPITFVEPWNPWFAVMPFLFTVLASWDCVRGHPWSLVGVVAGGSFAIQAHLGYAPVVAVLAVAAVAGVVWGRRREWRRLLVPAATAIAVAAVMWAPPLVEQMRGEPGNLTVLTRAYAKQGEQEDALGIVGGARLVGSYLDVLAPLRILDDRRPAERTPGLGTVALVLAWGLAVALAVRRRRDPPMAQVLSLHLVAGVGVLAAIAASAGIVGEVYGYLVGWLGVLVTVVALAVAWTAWIAFCGSRGSARAVGGWVLAVVFAGSALATTVRFADAPVPAAELEAATAELMGSVPEGLSREATYVLRWDDPLAFGGVGTGILSELERRGFDVGVDERLRDEMRSHRVVPPGAADEAIWVVTGAAIPRWQHAEGVEELAYVDPRTPAERGVAEAERRAVVAELRSIGGDELAEGLDDNYWVTRSDPRVPDELAERIDALAARGLPTAVFLAAADSPQR